MKFSSSYLIFLAFGFWLLASEILSGQTLTVTSIITNATCPTDSNGAVSVSVSGGSAPYTYQWQPDGQISPSVTGLRPGTYTITVSDNTGANSTLYFVVGPSPIMNDSTNNVQSPICTNDGYIQLSISGGTSPYTYSWNTGSANPGITQLSEGIYSVIVTDAHTCSASFSFTLVRGDCFISPDQYFTPNGDGFNDTWLIKNSQYFPEAKLIVYNRWGTRVYEHTGLYENWDGKSYLGIPVPDAVYYFFFYQDKSDKEKNAVRGSVTIIR